MLPTISVSAKRRVARVKSMWWPPWLSCESRRMIWSGVSSASGSALSQASAHQSWWAKSIW
jgi:hypothetical protein